MHLHKNCIGRARSHPCTGPSSGWSNLTAVAWPGAVPSLAGLVPSYPPFTRHCRAGLSHAAPSGLERRDPIPPLRPEFSSHAPSEALSHLGQLSRRWKCCATQNRRLLEEEGKVPRDWHTGIRPLRKDGHPTGAEARLFFDVPYAAPSAGSGQALKGRSSTAVLRKISTGLFLGMVG
jgi:hypothetical protein